MRFNPKADISGGRVSDAGRGGGGGGGMRIPLPGGTRAGGGIGGILIIILFVVLTQCVGGGLPSPGGDSQPQGQPEGIDSGDQRYANCRTGADAQDDPDCARKAVALSLEQYWAETLPDQGDTQFAPSTINTFAGGVNTGCGQATSQVGPFYCPADQQIYLDTSFFPEVLERELGGQGGDFVEPYVLAHEYGHHIQNLMGTMGQVRTQQGPESDAVRLELQADCYAGMWTRHAEDSELITLDEGDIAEALDSAKAVGDDRIQQRSGQGVNPDGWTHGSSEQRQAWFSRGYEEGSLEACDTFSASSL
ncbi:membrane protein [Nocardioides flavus (ex Wang et al. 2016)]|uniref:Membrane protein n=1 Tax=Nocardioides flavus (ex Wang et al. 2016) TaxID=2058780 RepID=A0ABQ3HRX3_9ACTN|nr:neutral zinc metallopeptidase [Nocardioides flavus (ex Wang et al. 2016)]GHE19411.1 membrane protein [Nocardioides flavus (ex Wang et al. 2016)]